MNLQNAKESMEKTIQLLCDNLVGMGDNVDDTLISSLKIEYNGESTPIKFIASVDKKDRKISITPYDSNLLGSIENLLKKNNFDAYKFSSKSVVVNIPLPSGEIAEKIKTHIKKLGEDSKVAIRNIRRKFKTKDNDKELQILTDQYIKEIDSLIGIKWQS
jgi:ribosome recycling factor